jgi:hypothetical protein
VGWVADDAATIEFVHDEFTSIVKEQEELARIVVAMNKLHERRKDDESVGKFVTAMTVWCRLVELTTRRFSKTKCRTI